MLKKVKFSVTGMTCAACSAHVHKAVSSIAGVEEVEVSLLTNSMYVSFTSPANEERICEAVTKAGYGASVSGKGMIGPKKVANEETPKLIRRLICSLLFLIPLFYFSMGYMNPNWGWPLGVIGENPFYYGLLSMTLSGCILLINHAFFVSGFRSLAHKAPNMDTLVSLGSGIAFVYGIVVMFLMSSVVGPNMDDGAWKRVATLSMSLTFETAGMVPTLITIGKTLESYSKGKTTNAIKSLLDLSPKETHLLEDGAEKTVPTESVKAGDYFLVRPGELVPVDGVVIEGESAVNESALSGESAPVDKKAGDCISAGTMNCNGAMRCQATQVGPQTTIQQIVKMVEDASMSKAKISRLADKVSGIFVPIVLGIAVLVFAGWMLFGGEYVNSSFAGETSLLTYALERCVSVLVVACPCALGLATPVAVMVGSGKGAKNGILFKTASSLEDVGKSEFIVLDKTGTLTKGCPVVTDFLPGEGFDEKTLFAIACSLECYSEHPLAKAILEKAHERNIEALPITEFKAIPGFGVTGILDGVTCQGGKLSWLAEKFTLDHELLQCAYRWSEEGKTPLCFSKGDRICGVIAVSDPLKEDSEEAVKEFVSLGLIPIMLTGDNGRTASFVAKESGIQYFKAELRPADKLAYIERLKKVGRVMMVGDGVNDAPSLTAADVGVAIGAGSDVAIDSADIVLVKGTLRDAAAAVRLSRRSLLNIKENLFWAFFYNIVMIPIASGAFSALGLVKLRPWYGAAAMALSSVTVVCNALRINCINIYSERSKAKKGTINLQEVERLFFEQKENGTMKKEITISGMMCEHCAAHVKNALSAVPGVDSAKVVLADKKAIVEGDAKDEVLRFAIEKAGYEVVSIDD